jgi:hypothetical protein
MVIVSLNQSSGFIGFNIASEYGFNHVATFVGLGWLGGSGRGASAGRSGA